jgi:cytochrome c oxidase subunit 2
MLEQLGLWTPAASTIATKVDWLLVFLMTVCGSMGLFIAFLLFYFGIRYRRRPGETRNPPATRQFAPLEWFWTITPFFIFCVMYVWGGALYYETYTAPDNPVVIYGIGKQWMWKFQQTTGQREINTLHVPVGRPVKMMLISEDVIHSFYVPSFRIHMDVIPQRYTSVWFEATRPGVQHLFCSEYCGTNHSGMIGQVIAMEPAKYQEWLTYQADGSLANRGRQIFLKYRCVSCHSADENARAPVLENLYGATVPLMKQPPVIADESYLRESILKPSAKIVAGFSDIMPPFAGVIAEEEITELVAFIRSLEHGGTPQRVSDFPPPPPKQPPITGPLAPEK